MAHTDGGQFTATDQFAYGVAMDAQIGGDFFGGEQAVHIDSNITATSSGAVVSVGAIPPTSEAFFQMRSWPA